jgi:hypothetical protein
MTTVDMGHVNFWLPPAASRKQAMPLYNKAGSGHQNSKSKFKPKSLVVTSQPGFITRPRDDGIEARGTCGTLCSEKSPSNLLQKV